MTWLLSTRIGRGLTAFAGALAAFLGVYLMGRREGAQNARQEAENADLKKANRIRDRVDAVEPVHPDDIKYRD